MVENLSAVIRKVVDELGFQRHVHRVPCQDIEARVHIQHVEARGQPIVLGIGARQRGTARRRHDIANGEQRIAELYRRRLGIIRATIELHVRLHGARR